MSFDIVNPVATPSGAAVTPARRPEQLEGQRLGIHINGKEYSEEVLDHVANQLQDRYKFADVTRWNKRYPATPTPFADEIPDRATVVVNGVGHCGASTSWSIRDAVEFERRGVPTATIISSHFKPVGRHIAGMVGLANLPIAEIAHPVGAAELSEVRRKADAVLDGVVAALTELQSVGETAKGPSAAPAWSDLAEVPGSAPGAASELNDFFADSGWTDGLPIVPPVEELVDAMVRAGGRDPEEVIGHLPPAGGAATVRRIAANAVMAGCLPEYLPVLLAAVEAVADPAYGLSHRQITTHAGAPLIIVNGPIAARLAINGATGLFGPGWRANSTIGRAMRLVLINIGGAVPGVTDMSQTGHPGKFSYCIAENEGANPWEPLHVERGYDPSQTTVTVVNAEAPHSVTDNVNTTAREILRTCASSLATLGTNNIYSQGEPILAIGPEHARYIAADGWGKRDIKLYIYEAARVPWRLVEHRGKSYGPDFPMWLERPEPDDMVPIVSHPDELIVIVAGGAGGKSMAIPTAGKQSRAVTRPVREP